MRNTVIFLAVLIALLATSGTVTADLPQEPGGPVGEITEEPSGDTVYSWAPGYGVALAKSQGFFHLGTINPNPQMTGPSDPNIDQTGIGYTLNGDGTLDITVKVWRHSPFSYPVNLNVWIDWDGDKTFEAGEQVIDASGFLPSGFNEYTWSGISIPGGAVSPTYLRAIVGYKNTIGPTCQVVDPGPTDTWCFGDVEDYLIPTTTGEIPEFPTVALPAIISVGGYLALMRRRKE